MKNIPKIKIIKKNLTSKELEVFLNFLNNPRYPQNRNKIFQAFPDLKLKLGLLSNNEKEKKIVHKFICDFYAKNKEKINQIIKESEHLIKKKSKIALEALSSLMDYKWPKSMIYYAIPTILPFSPFKGNSFNFSILGQIRAKNDKNPLFISIHEISHFIFFDILEKIAIKIPEDTKNYFKEALTAVLLNQKPLSDILELKNYRGNQEIHDLQIKIGKDIVSLTKFIEDYYHTIKIKKGKDFSTFLKGIMIILEPIFDEFSKKRKIWNKYGNQLSKNYEFLRQYRYPIEIEMPKE